MTGAPSRSPTLRGALPAVLLTVALASCGEEPSPEPAPVRRGTAEVRPRAAPAEAPPAKDARLREDCGGWVPSPDLIDAALDAPWTIPETARRIDALRAGLRLADDAAAKRCAARLEWKVIDRWECARCVDLLVEDVLRPGTEANFDEFRSYIGSVELGRYLRSTPPLPWDVDPVAAIGQMHRVARAEHIPDYLALAAARPEVARTAWSDVSLLCMWNDAYRDEIQRAYLADEGVAAPPADTGARGIPSVMRAYLEHTYLPEDWATSRDPENTPPHPTGKLGDWDRRWLWECVPSEADAPMLQALCGVCDPQMDNVAGAAFMLLGLLRDEASLAFLREEAWAGEEMARMALVRRGDDGYLEAAEEDARGGGAVVLALLMEAQPARARALIDAVVLRGTEEEAEEVLGALRGFVAPGAFEDHYRLDWRRTSFDGFEKAALDARLPAPRLARIGVVVPGCRTRAVALAAARALRAGDLDEEVPNGFGTEEAAFLETGAGEEFATALRAFAATGGTDAETARYYLEQLGDPACGRLDLGIVGTPEVRAHLAGRLRSIVDAGSAEDRESTAEQLAIAHGLPAGAAWSFGVPDALPSAVCELLISGRPVDALAELARGNADTALGDVAEVDDPRIREYLVSLRARRHLGHYWYATAQLAVLGDPDARRDWWGAMEDGRYRIMDGGSAFERTLGWNLRETMPFWISELRSQCCRVSVGNEGDIVDDVLGIDGHENWYRTAWVRAKELWDSAGGDFVRSRIAEHFVPRPR